MFYYNILEQAEKANQCKKQSQPVVCNVAEILYQSVVVLYVFKASLDTTLFYISWPTEYFKILRLLACIVIFLKIGSMQSYGRSKWIMGILTFVMFRNSWISTGYDFLLDTALLLIGAMGISYKKILKAGFWANFFVLLLAMFGSFTGSISDLVYLESDQFKHSFGIVYPTDFATHITFLFLIGWVLYGEAREFLSCLCALGLCIYVYYYTNSKCSTIVLLLSIISIFYIWGTEKYRKHTPTVRYLSKHIDISLTYAFFICAFIMISLTLLYDTENVILSKLDALLSWRLRLGRNAIDEYGISLFGKAFPQIGLGGTTAWSWTLEYNFVDSSYVLILVRYGLTILLIVCIYAVYMGRKALKHEQRRLLIATALVSVHSMIEHHFMEVEYNLFLLLPLAAYDTHAGDKKKRAVLFCNKKSTYAFMLCVSILATILFPRFVTYMKTIVDILRFDSRENRIYFIMVIAGCILWICLFARFMAKIIIAYISKIPRSRFAFGGMASLLFVFLVAFSKGETIIRQGQNEYSEFLESDRIVVEALLSDDPSEKLYIDHVPELYRREFSGISNKVLAAEGLATKKDSTVITRDEGELRALISAGYEYGKLPSGHAVYTNSESAKEILKEAGVDLTKHYSRQRFVNLQNAASQNGLRTTENGTLLLSGPAESLQHGPGITIYKGTLQICYKLHLISNISMEDNVATAIISSDGGLHIWKEENIPFTDFDKNGNCVYTLERRLVFDCPNVEFRLSVPDGVVLEVLEISFKKIE